MRVLVWTLAVFGAIMLLFLFAVFGFGAVGAGKIAVLSKEAAAYADASIAAYAKAWDEEVLMQRASPELVSALASNPGALESLSLTMDTQAGAFISVAPSACGKSRYSASTAAGEVYTAECVAAGVVAKGEATFKVSVVYRAREWRLLGFFVNVAPGEGQAASTLVSIIDDKDVHPVGLRAAFGARSIAVSPRSRSITYAVLREKAPLVGVHAEATEVAPIK